MKINGYKLTFISLTAGLTAYFEKMFIPLMVLLIVMIMDYISGILHAYIKGELSSRIGITGILKKACYLMISASGMVFDWLLLYATENLNLGFNYESYFFCTMVTIWLIVNEMISILENLIKLDLPVPEFLKNAILSTKEKIEGNKDDSKEEKNG